MGDIKFVFTAVLAIVIIFGGYGVIMNFIFN